MDKKNTIKLPSGELFPFMEEYMKDGREIIIQARGNSMFPLMRNDKDSLKLAGADFSDIRKYDVVLIRRTTGAYIIHRVCKKTKDAFYMVGDNQTEIEGPLYPDQLLAVTVEVYRGGRTIKRGSALWNIYARLWMFLRPVRKPVLAVLMKVYGKVTGKVSKS